LVGIHQDNEASADNQIEYGTIKERMVSLLHNAGDFADLAEEEPSVQCGGRAFPITEQLLSK
jgi:hypothetical protein